jgi:DNA invertase Pin-like site-specific DNA recombinase
LCRKIGYARVSTDEQNLGLQIDALTEAGCTEIYREEGVSAVAKERPQFAAALARLEAGDTLMIWKMDRAFRSLLHALQVLDDLERRAVDFRSLTDSIDTGTPVGRFAYQVTNAFAELERALIIERTKAGMAAARRRGVRIGRPRKLSDAQVEKARLDLAGGCVTVPDLAAALGVAPRTLSRCLAVSRQRQPELLPHKRGRKGARGLASEEAD